MTGGGELLNNLKTLHECPEEDPDGVSLPQQFDQSRCSEQSEESNIEKVFLKCSIQ